MGLIGKESLAVQTIKEFDAHYTMPLNPGQAVATFAGGCFWCTEAVFLALDGVKKVIPGYIGGKTLNPDYKSICSGDTGHAEAVQIFFDPKKLSFAVLLDLFFATHDPTTLNRQGHDVGTQYRSEIFYHTEAQKIITEYRIALFTKKQIFEKPILTQVSQATRFYAAEEYHQNYYHQNKEQGYCIYVIRPKIEKMYSNYTSLLKARIF